MSKNPYTPTLIERIWTNIGVMRRNINRVRYHQDITEEEEIRHLRALAKAETLLRELQDILTLPRECSSKARRYLPDKHTHAEKYGKNYGNSAP